MNIGSDVHRRVGAQIAKASLGTCLACYQQTRLLLWYIGLRRLHERACIAELSSVIQCEQCERPSLMLCKAVIAQVWCA